jgi:hypothetical protein
MDDVITDLLTRLVAEGARLTEAADDVVASFVP